MFAAEPTAASAATQQQQQQQFAVVTQQSTAAEATSSPTAAATPTAATALATAVATANVSTPSSLSGFLAPGGQLPVHKDSGGGGGGVVVTGKPSIVKVTLTPPVQQQHQHQHQQHPAQRPADDREQSHANVKYSRIGANNHQQAYQLPTTRSTDSFQSTPFRTSSANDWYYANYNRTNVEPFVSKTAAASGAGSALHAVAAIVVAAALVAAPTHRIG